MKISVPIQLKQKAVTFGDQEFQLYELSAYYRCEYLEKTSGDFAISKDGEPESLEFQSYGDLWSFRREDVKTRLLLVAYSIWMNPECSSSLEEINNGLIRSVSKDSVDLLYVPAAKLSGLFVEPEASQQDSEQEQEDPQESTEEESEKKE